MDLVCFYLIAHGVLHWVGLVLKFYNLLLHTKFLFDYKIFTGCVEEASRHPPVKYLGMWIILKFSHKLAYNH